MPNLGPGVPNNVVAAVTPTWVFTPTPNAPASVRFWNYGNANPVYLGGAAVSQFNGLPLYPGNRPVEFANMNVPMYVCSGATRGAASGTLTASATTAGTTTVTLAAAVPAALAAGTTIMIGNTTNTSSMDVNVVASTTASSALTFLSPLLYDHAASTVVYAATPNGGSVQVIAGVV